MYDGTNFQMQSTLGNAGSGGANASLSNLASTAINADLLPASAGGANIGSVSLPFNTVYANQFKVPGNSTAEIIGNEGSCSTSPIGTGMDVLCAGDATSHTMLTSYNGGAFLSVPQRVAVGTAMLGTTAVASGACSSTVTVTATGTLTTDRIEWTFASAPGTADGLLNLVAWVTANNVNFEQCNASSISQTPGGLVLNWAVMR